MDYGREARYSGGDVVQVLTGPQSKNVSENWAIWATEDDYGPSFGEGSDSNSNLTQLLTRSESEPPNKKAKTPPSSDSRAKAIGKMFFKTKLCCKFRAGACPYITNCNFAHSIEELRRPPPNWQEIVAGASPEPVEEFQIPSLGSPGFNGDTQRSFKGRRCKKFYSEEGCPYGEDCTFLHDEYSKDRESVAISLGPSSGGGYGSNANGPNSKPSNWKTRICNKWELTGYCPFGSKCHFAHGVEELHQFGGGQVEGEARDSPNARPLDAKHDAAAVVAAAATTVPQSDVYAGGIPSQRLSNVIQRTGQRLHEKWKGPDKISRIYGDWIDDIE